MCGHVAAPAQWCVLLKLSHVHRRQILKKCRPKGKSEKEEEDKHIQIWILFYCTVHMPGTHHPKFKNLMRLPPFKDDGETKNAAIKWQICRLACFFLLSWMPLGCGGGRAGVCSAYSGLKYSTPIGWGRRVANLVGKIRPCRGENEELFLLYTWDSSEKALGCKVEDLLKRKGLIFSTRSAEVSWPNWAAHI